MTSRVGPSVGQTDILRQMLRYVKDSFYPDLPGQGDQEEGIVAMYREIMDRTARLVAHWQTVRLYSYYFEIYYLRLLNYRYLTPNNCVLQ